MNEDKTPEQIDLEQKLKKMKHMSPEDMRMVMSIIDAEALMNEGVEEVARIFRTGLKGYEDLNDRQTIKIWEEYINGQSLENIVNMLDERGLFETLEFNYIPPEVVENNFEVVQDGVSEMGQPEYAIILRSNNSFLPGRWISKKHAIQAVNLMNTNISWNR